MNEKRSEMGGFFSHFCPLTGSLGGFLAHFQIPFMSYWCCPMLYKGGS